MAPLKSKVKYLIKAQSSVSREEEVITHPTSVYNNINFQMPPRLTV